MKIAKAMQESISIISLKVPTDMLFFKRSFSPIEIILKARLTFDCRQTGFNYRVTVALLPYKSSK
jgi:hypothetical protein